MKFLTQYVRLLSYQKLDIFSYTPSCRASCKYKILGTSIQRTHLEVMTANVIASKLMMVSKLIGLGVCSWYLHL